MNRNPSRRAGSVRLSQLTLAALGSFCALPGWAQSAAAPAPAASAPAARPAAAEAPPEASQTVAVTGSRIRGIAPIGANVLSMSRDDIETSGAVTTAQVLQQLPQVFNLGVSQNSRGQNGGAGNITYGSSVNLRGIGPFATLTLINGHRVIAQGTGASTVDPSLMPTLALERVEVVADGASAIYGSDAVAGVANLIMRRNEKGAQGFIRYGFGDSYNERQIGALWGTRWAGGQAVLSFENGFHTALNGRDRSFFRGDLRDQGGTDFRESQCNPGTIVISGVNYPIPAGGVTPATAATLVAGSANRCDNLKLQDLLPRQNRNSMAFTFNQALPFGIGLYADGVASERKYSFDPGPLTASLNVPSSNPYYVRPPSAPAGTSETVGYSFVDQIPVNTFTGHSKTYQVTVGADMPLPGGWRGGVHYTNGYNDELNVTTRGLNNAALAAALNSTDPATALNPFGSGPNSQAVLDSISNAIAYTPGKAHMQNYLLKGDGPLFELPGGTVRAAVGYEGQMHSVVGGQTTGTAAAPISGTISLERTVDSVYGELSVPLVGGQFTLPGVRRLDASVALRTDRYSDVGNTTNPKFGLNWSPVDSLTIKAGYGKSFRAPGLTQIRGFFNGGRGGLIVRNYFDPTIGGNRVGVVWVGPATELKPETAKTKSLGFDWTPAIGHKTRISLNYFDITYDNQIVGFIADTGILSREAQFAGTSVITRNPSPALQAELLANYPALGVPPAVWTLLIDGRGVNLSKSVSKGFDFQASTRIPTEALGTFGIGISGTVFTKYETSVTPNSPKLDQLNQIYNPMRFKARLSGTWGLDGWFASLYANHVNAYDNTTVTPTQKVAASTTYDLRVAYTFEAGGLLKDSTLSIGAVNLFDKKPPFVNVAQNTAGGGGFDPTLVSPVGRIVSVGLDKKF